MVRLEWNAGKKEGQIRVKDRHVIARKPHKCELCEEDIREGEHCIQREFFTFYHEECYERFQKDIPYMTKTADIDIKKSEVKRKMNMVDNCFQSHLKKLSENDFFLNVDLLKEEVAPYVEVLMNNEYFPNVTDEDVKQVLQKYRRRDTLTSPTKDVLFESLKAFVECWKEK